MSVINKTRTLVLQEYITCHNATAQLEMNAPKLWIELEYVCDLEQDFLLLQAKSNVEGLENVGEPKKIPIEEIHCHDDIFKEVRILAETKSSHDDFNPTHLAWVQKRNDYFKEKGETERLLSIVLGEKK